MTTIHVGADGAVVELWGRDDTPTVAVCRAQTLPREHHALTDGMSFLGAVRADDSADADLPGDGWQQRGGRRIGEQPLHWAR